MSNFVFRSRFAYVKYFKIKYGNERIDDYPVADYTYEMDRILRHDWLVHPDVRKFYMDKVNKIYFHIYSYEGEIDNSYLEPSLA